MEEKQILQQVQSIIAETLRISPEEVKPGMALGHELGAESLDFVDIIFRIQSEFKIHFYEGGLIEKLSEVFGPEVLSDGDRLTDLGAEVLRRRMPEVDPSKINPGMSATSIGSLYTPATFVRLSKELIEAGPRVCSSCGSTNLKATAPSLLLCQACRAEVLTPTQEELVEAWAKRTSKSLIDSRSSLVGISVQSEDQ